jgi:hypothetical protein
MNLPENVEKYLKKHSVPKWNIELSKDGKYDNIIVIPAISEFENIKFVLGSLIENDAKYFSSTLVVFVINNLETSEERIKSDNEISLYFLRNIINGQANDDLSAALIS